MHLFKGSSRRFDGPDQAKAVGDSIVNISDTSSDSSNRSNLGAIKVVEPEIEVVPSAKRTSVEALIKKLKLQDDSTIEKAMTPVFPPRTPRLGPVLQYLTP